jgi:hypothetical protein
LGKRGLLLQAPKRDELDVTSGWRNRSSAPHPWKNFAEAQTRRALRGNRRHYCRIAYTLAGMADELIAEHIRFQAVEPRSSVRDRLRHEGVDSKLGGVNRFTTVADVIDHFLSESGLQRL